jgi:hypothetical protein
MRRNLRILQRRPGVAAVEACFVLPFLFYLLLGVWEAGRMINVYQVLTNAAREAARDAASGQRSCSPYSVYVYDVNGNPLLANDPTIAWQAQLTALNYIRNAGLPLSTGTSVKVANLGPVGSLSTPPVLPAGGYNSLAAKWSYTANYASISGNKIQVSGSGSGQDPGAEANRPDPATGTPADLLFVHLSYADFNSARWNAISGPIAIYQWGTIGSANVTLVTESAWYTARDAPVNVDTDSPGSSGWNKGNPAPLPPL